MGKKPYYAPQLQVLTREQAIARFHKLEAKRQSMKRWMVVLLVAAAGFALFGPMIVTLIRKGF